ncbi:MAG: hypothetical protein P8Y35_07355 [Sulfurovaceae bacterium]
MALNKIAVFLRKDWKVNRFRSAIQSAFCSDDITEMILCSGFFQEDTHFKASNSFKKTVCTYPPNIKTLKLVGIYSYTWKTKFDDFANNLILNNCPMCLNVKKYRVPGMKFHAKMMIGKIKNEPVIATIGSSNITGRAFGIQKNFNYESDVILWDESVGSINTIMNSSIEEFINQSDEVIVSDYSENDWRNGQQTLNDKIKQLEEDIFDVAVETNE